MKTNKKVFKLEYKLKTIWQLISINIEVKSLLLNGLKQFFTNKISGDQHGF